MWICWKTEIQPTIIHVLQGFKKNIKILYPDNLTSETRNADFCDLYEFCQLRKQFLLFCMIYSPGDHLEGIRPELKFCPLTTGNLLQPLLGRLSFLIIHAHPHFYDVGKLPRRWHLCAFHLWLIVPPITLPFLYVSTNRQRDRPTRANSTFQLMLKPSNNKSWNCQGAELCSQYHDMFYNLPMESNSVCSESFPFIYTKTLIHQ